jgi:hypothetical protein
MRVWIQLTVALVAVAAAAVALIVVIDAIRRTV